MRLATLRPHQGSVKSSSSYTCDISKKLVFFFSGFFVGSMFNLLKNVDSDYKPPGLVPMAKPQADKGWQSIDVYFGSNDEAISLLRQNQKWFSQARQDEAVLSLLRYKRNGFFIDLAANDATVLSNTFVLEHDFNWDGLCIEPNPIYWYNLTHYRPKCKLVGAVVGRVRMEQIPFLYRANEHGGLVGKEFDNGQKFQKYSVEEYTIPLLDIFQKYQVPRLIDYVSLDVEGAESFIMSTFPLADYRIKLLTIERPKDSLRNLLETNGYKQIQRLTRWGETLWSHQDFVASLDLSRIDDFNAKKQYLAQKTFQNPGKNQSRIEAR